MGDKIDTTERYPVFITIPSEVFFDKTLSGNAKLLYGLIVSLCSWKKYCWAKNETFARYFDRDESIIRRWLRELKDKNYITVEQGNDGGTTVRKIFANISATANPYDRPGKNAHPPGQKCPDRPGKNAHQNNININNIPPIAPQGGSDYETAATDDEPKPKARVKRRPTGEVALPEDLEKTFETFWAAYPDHRDKQKARQRWGQLKPDGELLTTILRAIEALKTTEQWKDGKQPMPSTFLNNRRWEDAEGIAPAAPQTEPQQGLPGGEWLE